MLDDMQSPIMDDDISIDDDVSDDDVSIEDMSLDIELSIGGQLDEDDIIELSMAELDEASWAKPGTTAAAKVPATSRPAIRAICFFKSLSLWGLFLQGSQPAQIGPVPRNCPQLQFRLITNW
jgi:hypothetical protein